MGSSWKSNYSKKSTIRSRKDKYERNSSFSDHESFKTSKTSRSVKNGEESASLVIPKKSEAMRKESIIVRSMKLYPNLTAKSTIRRTVSKANDFKRKTVQESKLELLAMIHTNKADFNSASSPSNIPGSK